MRARTDTDGGAVLHARRAPFVVDRFAPQGHVARFVDHYWFVSWRLEAHVQHRQLVVSHPVVNLTVSADGAAVVGPSTKAIERQLVGSGWTYGVMFRPAGFWPLLQESLASITDKQLTLTDVLPNAADAIELAGNTDARRRDADGMHAVLSRLLPDAPQNCEVSTALAERAQVDREIVRVEQLAAVAGVSARTLERRFKTHVGLNPKKVIQRYRIHEVAERAHAGNVNWALVAAELGYSDQAHLIRDFRAVTGESPSAYASAENDRSASSP